jgi:hypothetical protein
MRSSTYKIIFICLIWCHCAYAADLSAYENQCAEIGFKRKTPAFGDCVLELHSRGSPAPKTQNSNANLSGDGSPDHATCSKYGFRVGTTEYAQCRMQIDLARNQAQEQQRQYEEQIAAQQKAKDKAKGEAALLLGLGMMAGGGQRQPIYNNFNALQPPQMDRIYNLPGGKFMRCSTMGMVTNCN